MHLRMQVLKSWLMMAGFGVPMVNFYFGYRQHTGIISLGYLKRSSSVNDILQCLFARTSLPMGHCGKNATRLQIESVHVHEANQHFRVCGALQCLYLAIS